MDLYEEIILRFLENHTANIVFPNLKIDPAKIVELQCYKTLQKIQAVIEDDSLDDPQCYAKIEKIIRSLEDAGMEGRERHD